MTDFIRPAARAHWFEEDDSMEWGLSPSENEGPVSPCFEDGLISHPSWCSCAVEAECATQTEAQYFWEAGGWDK